MLNLRNALPNMEDTTGQLQDWAKDGYGAAREMVKADSFMWGAASLGVGALMGGLYALWRRNGKSIRPQAKAVKAMKTMAAHAGPKRSKRSAVKANGAKAPAAKRPVKRRAKEAAQTHQAANA